jgi:hypothetical protein
VPLPVCQAPINPTISSTENEIREKKGRDPDFPWKNKSLGSVDSDAEKERDAGDSEIAPDDMRPWGSPNQTPEAAPAPESPEGPGPGDDAENLKPDSSKTKPEP